MVTLYQSGGGCSECDLIKPVGLAEAWVKLRNNALTLLSAQHNGEAAQILETEGFELFEATNGFGDEFFALAKKAKADAYVDYANKAHDEALRYAYVNLASVFTHMGFFVRFIVVELDTDADIDPVSIPAAVAPVEIIMRALRDAEQLLSSSGAISAIDRAHTALHGYLKWICEQAGTTPTSRDPNITELLKAAARHPKLSQSATHSETVEKILRAFASAVDAINQVRNRGSMAHPNETLVDEADAMLVLNATRTIFRYFDDRLKWDMKGNGRKRQRTGAFQDASRKPEVAG
jgi:hypothetical protein